MDLQVLYSKSKRWLHQRGRMSIAQLLPTAGLPSGLPSASLFNPNGIPIGKLGIQFLTLFPPSGFVGLNLSAAQLPITAAIKAATYGIGLAIAIFANKFYVDSVAKFLAYVLTFAPPWYIFDCIQVLADSTFTVGNGTGENGFKLPLPVIGVPAGGSEWLLTMPILSLILASSSLAGLSIIMQYVPESITGKYMPYIQGSMGGTAGLFVVAALASSFLLKGPQISAPPLPQMGGGQLPPLSSFVKNMPLQTGGGESKEAIPFLGILALIILGGSSLSFLRSKQT